MGFALSSNHITARNQGSRLLWLSSKVQSRPLQVFSLGLNLSLLAMLLVVLLLQHVKPWLPCLHLEIGKPILAASMPFATILIFTRTTAPCQCHGRSWQLRRTTKATWRLAMRSLAPSPASGRLQRLLTSGSINHESNGCSRLCRRCSIRAVWSQATSAAERSSSQQLPTPQPYSPMQPGTMPRWAARGANHLLGRVELLAADWAAPHRVRRRLA